MSWTRSSKSVALVVLFAVSLAAAGQAVALSVSADGVPEQSQVGDGIEVTMTIDDPFVDMPDQWTLRGSTELRNVSWRVTVLQQGETIEDGDTTFSSESFEQPLNASNGGDTIEITLAGDAPPVNNYQFESNETFTLYDLDRATGNSGTDIDSAEAYHYTQRSKDAREAIMRAERAIEETNAGDAARSDLADAKSFYNGEQFDRAISNAQSAQESAQSSQQSSQLLLFGGVGIVVLVLVGGGIYYWRSQQDDYGKLQ